MSAAADAPLATPAAAPLWRVALWMTGAISGFTAMAMAGRKVAPWHDTFEIMTWRSFTGLVVVVAVALATGNAHQIRLRNMGLHAVRNLSHFTGQNLWFAALTLIPLAQVFAIEFSYPIIVALAAPFLLNERLTVRRMGAAALGFVGVLIVAQPWGTGGVNLGTILVMIASFAFAGSAMATKRLTARAPLTEILFWLTAMQFTFGVICAGWDGSVRWPTAQSLPWLICIGLAGLGAHLCMTRALSLAPATVVAPFDFLRLPLIAVVGALVYGEALSAHILVGGAIILLANWINLKTTNPVPKAVAK